MSVSFTYLVDLIESITSDIIYTSSPCDTPLRQEESIKEEMSILSATFVPVH